MVSKEIKSKINLACGNVFVSGNGWINFDYIPINSSVVQTDLLRRLPLPDNIGELVYSSHFLEHIPRNQVSFFLSECFRVLSPGGLIRLVLPDLENMCRAYIEFRDTGEHEKADFLVLEMVDQCVRQESGGELGQFYKTTKNSLPNSEVMVDFIRSRNGENLKGNPVNRSINGLILKVILNKTMARIQNLWIRLFLNLLPSAFRSQNISYAHVGERHQWIWDYYQLKRALEEVGFVNVQRFSASTSGFPDFPFNDLDLDSDGLPRKGLESMYIEAQKP